MEVKVSFAKYEFVFTSPHYCTHLFASFIISLLIVERTAHRGGDLEGTYPLSTPSAIHTLLWMGRALLARISRRKSG